MKIPGSQKKRLPAKKFFFLVPNIVFELGLTPHELILYFAIRRTTDESNVCFRSGANLARLCRMSPGKVSEAKQELCRVHYLLSFKPLIRITKVPARHGGKPCDHISLVDIWPENERFFRSKNSPGEVASLPHELATSADELATSLVETKKTPIKKIPLTITKEGATPSNPSSREVEREIAQEEILRLWRFVCTLFNRPSERSPNRREIKLLKELLPVAMDEYELTKWWFNLDSNDYDFRGEIGFHLRRRPRSVSGLLQNWNGVNDVARAFRRELDERGYLI